MKIFEITKKFPKEETYSLTTHNEVGKLITYMINNPFKHGCTPVTKQLPTEN